YHLAAAESLLVAVRGEARESRDLVPDHWAELDLLLTDAFLTYGSHLLAGRVDPQTLEPTWIARRRSADFATLLETALASGDIAGTLATLEPPYAGFRRLREALVHQRDVAARGGWPLVPVRPLLKLGVRDPAVSVLRQRLLIAGDLMPGPEPDAELFDRALEDGVKRFQQRHGLKSHGLVDTITLAELNVSAERRVEQMELNLERWRWLPQDLGRRHILVNIAAFEMQVVEGDSVALAMRVMVGRPDSPTPVFS